MEIDVTGKVIIVTGAAQGIGRTLALGLAADGARVGPRRRGDGRGVGESRRSDQQRRMDAGPPP